MKKLKVEILTACDLKVGQLMKGILVEDEFAIEGLETSKLVKVINAGNQKVGYVSKKPLYGNTNRVDLISAMTDLKAIDVDLEVSEIKRETGKNKIFYTCTLEIKSDNIKNHILGIDTKELANNLVSKLIGDEIIDNLNLQANTSEARKTEIDSDFKSEYVFSVRGKANENPKKTTLIKMLKESDEEQYPKDLEIVQDNEVFRVVFNGEFAGELQDVPSEFDATEVSSVECIKHIPMGYSIKVIMNQPEVVVEENPVEEVQVEEQAMSNIEQVEEVVSNTSVKPKQVVVQKRKKADKSELEKIIQYLAGNGISEKLITSIINSHIEYEPQYLDRIPHSSDANFTPWKRPKIGLNLLEIAIVSIEQGLNTRMIGGKGAGKNTLLNTLAWIYQRPLFSQSANRDTDITHLFGDKTIEVVDVDGVPVQIVGFQKGLLVEAMEVGGFYEFGEGNTCKADVCVAIHSALDDRREADVNNYKLVKAHKNFSFVLTMNIDYEGCNELNQAFRDRFMTIPFPSPEDITKILKDACPQASDDNILVCNKLYQALLNRVEELQSDDIVTIRGYINAIKMSVHLPLRTALECCIAYNVSDDNLIVAEIKQMIENLVA